LPGQFKYQCDLEESFLCGWQNVAPDFNWIWVAGNEGEIGVDHSYDTGKGHYLQISSNQPNSLPNNQGIMRIPTYRNLNEAAYCFQLYYVRWGGTAIKIQAVIKGEVEDLTELHGADVTEWQLLQQTYNNFVQGQNVTFRIVGIMGNTDGVDGSSVATIDDFSLATGSCPEAGSCSFENSHWCTWHSDPSDPLQWHISDGRETHVHGPDHDHTRNDSSGGYLVLEDYNVHTGEVAALISELIDYGVEGFCFQFWFSVHGDPQAKLKVSTQDSSKKSVLWKLTGDNDPEWTFGQVPMSLSDEGQFEIVIEAIPGDNENGWIAIDDLYLSEAWGGCSIDPPGATPSPLATTTA
ncbi:unnamed protein product, partial [Meganyctiphanes norvegica]